MLNQFYIHEKFLIAAGYFVSNKIAGTKTMKSW